jgi:transcriptional regulator GlxA family with amidase domain
MPLIAEKAGNASLLTNGRHVQTGLRDRRFDHPVRRGASLDLTGPLEVFSGASEWCRQGDRHPEHTVTTASVGGEPVRSGSGLRITPDVDLTSVQYAPDLLIVPGGRGGRRREPELVGWLRANAPCAMRLASVCTGAFLLAEAGLLDGRMVTTHWRYCDALAREYPALTVHPDPTFIRDGSVTTSAPVRSALRPSPRRGNGGNSRTVRGQGPG